MSLTISDAAAALGRGETTASRLLDSILDRIEQTDGELRAYAFIDREGARTAAEASDARREEGKERGLLDGIPVSIKDVIDTAGIPTECGSRVLSGRIPSHDATLVARLRDAGAIVVGKAVTKEFATGNSLPPTTNPWDPKMFSGSSSSGSGAAVAAGTALASVGSDSGGSIRQPAALCGVVGLKPTYGRVSRAGLFPSGSSMDQAGPLTRTVEDCASILQVIAGPDPRDPTSAANPVPDYMTGLGELKSGLRLGVFGQDEECDPQVAHAVAAACDVLSDMGIELIDVPVPNIDLDLAAAFTILMADQAAAHLQWMRSRPDDYQRGTWLFLAASEMLSAPLLAAAHRYRRTATESLAATYGDLRLDAIVGPTLPVSAAPLAEIEAGSFYSAALVRYTVQANLTGLPALSIPCGFSSGGLPIGLQLTGRPFDEAQLFAIGHAYQTSTDWHRRRPPVGSGSPVEEVT